LFYKNKILNTTITIHRTDKRRWR